MEKNNRRNLEKGSVIKSVTTSGDNICRRYNHPIDDELVNILKPHCIEDMNGCGNCPECGYEVKQDVR